MKLWLNIFAQVLLSSGQMVNLVSPLLDEHQKAIVAVVLGVSQIVVSKVAHAFNPDGSPAEQPYSK